MSDPLKNDMVRFDDLHLLHGELRIPPMGPVRHGAQHGNRDKMTSEWLGGYEQ